MNKPCGCEWKHVERVRRAWWMRLMPLRHVYRCADCGVRFATSSWKLKRTKLS